MIQELKYLLDLQPVKHKIFKDTDTYVLIHFVIKLCITCKEIFVKTTLLGDTVQE